LPRRCLIVCHVLARGFVTGKPPAHNRLVVRAINRETKLLPIPIDEERDHDQIRQNDPGYCKHLDIPFSGFVIVAHLRDIRILDREKPPAAMP